MNKTSLGVVLGSLAVASGSASAASISWNAPGITGAVGVPVGGVMTLLLGMLLAGVGYWFISRRGKYFQQMAIAAISASVVLFASGGKLISDANAVALYPITSLTTASGSISYCETGVHEIINNYSSTLTITAVDSIVDAVACGFGSDTASGDNAANVPPSPECVAGTQLGVGTSCFIEVIFPQA